MGLCVKVFVRGLACAFQKEDSGKHVVICKSVPIEISPRVFERLRLGYLANIPN